MNEETSIKKYISCFKDLANKPQNIEEGFDLFRKDIKKFGKTKGMKDNKRLISDKETYSTYNTLKSNLKGTIIFNIANEKNEIKTPFKFLPFDKMFISCPIFYPLKDELIFSNGFYILDIGSMYITFFFWTNIIKDGWSLEYLVNNKLNLEKETKCINPRIECVNISKSKIEFLKFFGKESHRILRILLSKIEKKEYTSYQKWTPSGTETKEIVYSRDVSSHKRHFWKDSGKFKIPLMSKEELTQKGYGTDEVVFRDGELRRDVPYRIIGSFVTGGDKGKKENNKVISLLKRRNLRCEEKIYKIFREIYPDKIIRRHDRKTLKGIELDFNIPELRLGIEYDGEQHFDKELYDKLYGDGFEAQVRRDRLKDKLCKKKNINLIRIRYDEPLTKSHIKKRLN